MEKKFYQDNFEQFLKETTDNFRMYPSKRVWHSIYNDLHPSRKWPSLAVCLLLISSVMYIGLTNKNHIETKQPTVASSNLQANVVTIPKTINTDISIKEKIEKSNKREMLTNLRSISPNLSDQTRLSFPGNNNIENDELSENISGNRSDKDLVENFITKGLIPDQSTAPVSENENLISRLNENASGIAKNNELKKKPAITQKLSVNADKEWIEDYAFHNKPYSSKWKSRVTYQIYATPSIGYRKLTKNTSYSTVLAPSLVATPPVNTDYESAVSHIPAVNMELGGNILYSVSNKINLKLGVQFNYSNYNINAYDLKHPTMTTVMLNDLNSGYPMLVSKPSTLANIDAVYNTKLNSNTYQVSLPIGADVKILGNSDLKWFAGATIQPTYIAGGNAYLISSDLKNYVDGNSMLRSWNLNAGVETFVSYKTKSGIILNAGPQFRYQMLSTLTKEYTYDEKLYNLGIKIGVITKF